jgi:hypothetical protein
MSALVQSSVRSHHRANLTQFWARPASWDAACARSSSPRCVLQRSAEPSGTINTNNAIQRIKEEADACFVRASVISHSFTTRCVVPRHNKVEASLGELLELAAAANGDDGDDGASSAREKAALAAQFLREKARVLREGAEATSLLVGSVVDGGI